MKQTYIVKLRSILILTLCLITFIYPGNIATGESGSGRKSCAFWVTWSLFTGAGIGSFLTLKYLEKELDRIFQEAIAAVSSKESEVSDPRVMQLAGPNYISIELVPSAGGKFAFAKANGSQEGESVSGPQLKEWIEEGTISKVIIQFKR